MGDTRGIGIWPDSVAVPDPGKEFDVVNQGFVTLFNAWEHDPDFDGAKPAAEVGAGRLG